MPPKGLYAITDEHLLADRLIPAVTAALEGGIVLLQYRRKTGEAALRRHEAECLLALCQRYQVPLLINDDVELAQQIGADGVHLGRSDATLQAARRVLGSTAIIGATCHNSLAFAQEATTLGANYLAFGAMFSSQTKPNTPLASPLLFAEAKHFKRPLVAIGGISTDNGASVIQAGADYLAVIQSLWSAPDIRLRAQQFAALFA